MVVSDSDNRAPTVVIVGVAIGGETGKEREERRRNGEGGLCLNSHIC